MTVVSWCDNETSSEANIRPHVSGWFLKTLARGRAHIRVWEEGVLNKMNIVVVAASVKCNP